MLLIDRNAYEEQASQCRCDTDFCQEEFSSFTQGRLLLSKRDLSQKPNPQQVVGNDGNEVADLRRVHATG